MLPAIIDSGLIERIKYLQVQFHNFDPNAAEARSKIRKALENTHREMWNLSSYGKVGSYVDFACC